MTEPDQNDPVSSSEMTNTNAASPMPVLNSIRPPSAGLPHLTLKPSSAPPPRLRPAAPPDAPNNIGPGASSKPILTEVEISATQEIAEALTSAHRSEAAHVVPRTTQPAPSSAHAPAARAQPGARTADPLFVRRTIIPILLTGGVILAGAGALLLFDGEDNAFPGWVPIMFCVLASICLGFALLNMLSVKNAKP